MTLIRSLAYIGFGAEDLPAWERFATTILGLQVEEDEAFDGLRLRMDSRAYRLAVEPGTNGALHYLGFEVAKPSDLQQLREMFDRAGVAVLEVDPQTSARRRVLEAFAVIDPFGNRIEFCTGVAQAETPFVSPTGARFVTGELGVGHAFLWVPDIDQFVAFYVELLGFTLSDTYEESPGNLGYFLHCNSRHHTLAAMVMANMPIGLGHIMLEVTDSDMVGYAYDKVINAGIPIFGTLGRHANDLMMSFYAETPSMFPVEYGVDGRLIDDTTWLAGHYTKITLWGHAQPGAPRA